MNRTVRWAIAVMVVMIGLAFVTPASAPQFLLIGMIAVTLYLVVDASRLRLSPAFQTAAQFNGDNESPNTIDRSETPSWHRQAEWDDPLPAVSYWETFSRRLQQSYFILYIVFGGAWFLYLAFYSTAEGWREAAAIPGVPGSVVISVVIGFYLFLIVLTLWSVQRRSDNEQQ